jgi:hypothetical protein
MCRGGLVEKGESSKMINESTIAKNECTIYVHESATIKNESTHYVNKSATKKMNPSRNIRGYSFFGCLIHLC